MLEWFKSLFGHRKTEKPSTDTTHGNELLEQFEAFLAGRMEEFYPCVRDAFATLMGSGFPDSTTGLHIEVFLDEPAFSFRVFSKGKSDAWADEPEAVKELNDTIDRIWPIVTENELDQYMIWEDDPKWGRQVALEQPLDKLNVAKIVVPWFKKMVSETRGDFSYPITVSVHDLTVPEEL